MRRTARAVCLLAAVLLTSPVYGAIATVASVDPLLGPPILYDSGTISPSLLSSTNGGLAISGIEVLGPGMVFTTTDDGMTISPFFDDSSVIQLNVSAGPGTNVLAGFPAALVANSRGYDLTLNPGSGLLGVAATAGLPAAFVPAIWELDPAGIAPPAMYAALSAAPTTSGLTYGPGGASAILSTDGIPGGGAIPPLPGGIYSVPAGGPEAVIALDAAPAPGGVVAPGDDHVITLDGRTIFVNDGSHLMHDVSGGAGAVALLIDLTTIPAVVPSLAIGGVRADVNPVDGDIFTGWGLGGPAAPPGGSSILRVDEFGAGAAVSIVGLDNTRDIAFGPSTFAPAGPLATGVSMYVTETEFSVLGPLISNIWEFPILVPEPSTTTVAMMFVALLAVVRRR